MARCIQNAPWFLAVSVLLAIACGTSCAGDSVERDADSTNGTADAGAQDTLHPNPDDGNDAEAADADPAPDAEPLPDAGPPPDAGMPWNQSSCLECGSGCPGGLCLRNREGELFCADSCDENLEACLPGFSCIDIDVDSIRTSYFCLFPVSCEVYGSAFGTPCAFDLSACQRNRTHCEGDGVALGYCTDACIGGSGCPPGYACGLGDEGYPACLSTFATDAEECGRARHADGVPDEIPCALDRDCALLSTTVPGARCVRTEPSLPGICAVPCDDPGGCSPGQGCVGTTAFGRVCLSDRCACHGDHLPLQAPPGTRDLLGEALAASDLSRCASTFSIFDFAPVAPDVLDDGYRLSFFDKIHHEPLRAPAWSRTTVGRVDQAANGSGGPSTRAARIVEELARLADRPAVHHAPGVLDPVEPLAHAVALLITEAGGVPDPGSLIADAADVSTDLQLALAEVVDGVRLALVGRKNATSRIRPQTLKDLYQYGAGFVAARADRLGLAPANPTVAALLNTDFLYGEIYGGAADLLDAIDRADLGRFAATASTAISTGTVAVVATSSATFLFVQDTPIGRIAIGNRESRVYDPREPGFEGAFALLIDLGGNDVYKVSAGGNVSAENAVSVLIDLDGKDRYGYVEVPHPLDGARLVSDEGGRYSPTLGPSQDNGPVSFSEVPRQGGARVGTAVLVDLGEDDDRYESLRMSQGAGVFGVGVLVDDGGDDVYLAETFSQGAGSFGIGLQIDLGGADVRRAYSLSQGFAFARAVGLLYDALGDDEYLMDVGDPAFGGDPLYLSPQRPGLANTTLGQGFAFGRRADSTDRAFMSGGLGLLVDAAGNDRYEASIFAQGGGYWFGTGILADERGNDRYDSMWYGMASAAHYALGVLLEGAGDDIYGGTFPRINVTIAGGHDYSAAILVDEAGSDTYSGSRISLGAGNANGIGIFVDNAGDDVYSALSPFSIGSAGLLDETLATPGSARRKVDVIGVFVDAGGTDSYDQASMTPATIADDSAWLQNENPDPAVQAIEHGTGVDGAGESTLHARWP